jgi:predicted transcriptional regulator
MLDLKNKLGEQSGLLSYLQQQGPQSAGQARALASLDSTRLREYEMLFNRKGNIATDMAAQAVATETVREKKLEQVVININGGVVTQNVDALVQLITRQLQVNGVM